MNRKVRTVWRVLRCGIGLGLLSYVLAETGIELIGPRLRSIGWLWAGLVALTCLGTVIEARRLGLLFASQGMRLPFGIGVRLVAIGTFFNLAVPGGTGGDLVKLYYLASGNRGRGIESATVLFVDRVKGDTLYRDDRVPGYGFYVPEQGKTEEVARQMAVENLVNVVIDNTISAW